MEGTRYRQMQRQAKHNTTGLVVVADDNPRSTYLETKIGTIEVTSGLSDGSGVPHFGHADNSASDTTASS